MKRIKIWVFIGMNLCLFSLIYYIFNFHEREKYKYKLSELDYFFYTDKAVRCIIRSPVSMKIQKGDYDGFIDEYKRYSMSGNDNKLLLDISLLYVKKSYNNVLIFEFMLNKGVDLNMPPPNEIPLLGQALYQFDPLVIRLLLANGADPFEVLIRDNVSESSIAWFFVDKENKDGIQDKINGKTRIVIAELLQDFMGKEAFQEVQNAYKDRIRKNKLPESNKKQIIIDFQDRIKNIRLKYMKKLVEGQMVCKNSLGIKTRWGSQTRWGSDGM